MNYIHFCMNIPEGKFLEAEHWVSIDEYGVPSLVAKGDAAAVYPLPAFDDLRKEMDIEFPYGYLMMRTSDGWYVALRESGQNLLGKPDDPIELILLSLLLQKWEEECQKKKESAPIADTHMDSKTTQDNSSSAAQIQTVKERVPDENGKEQE